MTTEVALQRPLLGDIQYTDSEEEEEEEEDDDERLLPVPSAWFQQEGPTFLPPTTTTTTRSTDCLVSHDQPVLTSNEEENDSDFLETMNNSNQDMPSPQKAPSLKDYSQRVLPKAAKELLGSSVRKIVHSAKLTLAHSKWQQRYTDLGSIAGWQGEDGIHFSSLKWTDRQLVKEWRTIGNITFKSSSCCNDFATEEDDFERARRLIPAELPKPVWKQSLHCQQCRQPFGPSLLRHHCRSCGGSFCDVHSKSTHRLPQFGYIVDERVCDDCKSQLLEQALSERVAWRLARARDYLEGDLTPYFETGVDTVEDAALRLTRAAIELARKVPLGAQAHVAVETVEVLRKHGLKGIYGLVLRKEFLAAADLLCRACGINKHTWPLSVHELSAAIFYAIAQHRAMRGMHPEREHLIHTFRCNTEQQHQPSSLVDETDNFNPRSQSIEDLIALADAAINENAGPKKGQLPCRPVCDPVPESVLNSCLFYAPIALNFIYAEREVDMQLLCAQQGWRLLYLHLEQEAGADRPGSALLLHSEQKIACFAIRGTATINDVVTDIRQMPLPFPEEEGTHTDEWTKLSEGQGLAVCGMARAATNLYREHIDVLHSLAREGYRIRIVGHSLGAGVATLLGCLVLRHLEKSANLNNSLVDGKAFVRENDMLRVYGYGPPSCVDARLSDYVQSFVTTVVLHDDVVPRLTPTSIRGLLKHLLFIRETWVKAHLHEDLTAITTRARSVWAPRWKSGFTLGDIARQQYQYGKRKFLSVKGKLSQKISPVRKDEISKEKPSSPDAKPPEIPDDASRPVVDMLGGIDSRVPAVVVDGEEFFDADDDLVEGDDDDDASVFLEALEVDESVLADLTFHTEDGSWANFEEQPDIQQSTSSLANGLEETDEQAAVMLDETPLPRMFLPGKIVHIYTHRGGYKASFVPRAFRELRRISLAANMLADHTCKSYYEALLEVQTIKAAPEGLPPWTAFDENDTCSCCASRFTWASTSDSEAQSARDKHNCRSCGGLVCDPCAKNRIPLPSIGLTIPSRVCDRCYNDRSGADLSPAMERRTTMNVSASQRRERKRERRSSVVDDLASRIHSTVACS